MTASPMLTPTATALSVRAASRAVLVMLGGALAYSAYAWYLALGAGAWQLYVVGSTTLGLAGLSLAGLWLVRRRQIASGIWLTVVAFLVANLVIGSLIQDLGLALAVIVPVLTAGLVGRLLPVRASRLALVVAVLTGLSCLALDRSLPESFRLAVPGLQVFTPIVAALLAAAYSLFLLRVLADYSLRAKLIIAFLVVSLVPLGILAVLNERSTRRVLTDTANKTLLGVAQQTALSLDTFINNTKGVILTESQNPVLRDYLSLAPEERTGSDAERAVRTLLPIWQLRDTRARAYMVLDGDGVVVASTFSLDVGDNYSESSFFREAVATGQTYVSHVTFAPRATQGDLYFSMVIRGQGSQPLGVLVARYNARVVQDIIETTNGLAGADSFGVVFDDNLVHLGHGTAPETVFKLVGPATPQQVADLQVIGRLPTTPDFEPSTNLPDLAQKLANSSAEPFFTAEDVATGDRLNQVAVTRLTTRPWLVAFFLPRDVFLAPVAEQTQATVALAALIAVVVTGAALLGAQVLSDPITRLTKTAEQVAGGDLTVQAEVEGRDEIAKLSQAFNAMTARLGELVSTLEQRVAERTAQLQAAADISRTTASVRDLDELLRLALELIRDRFGFYHASIFLVDETGRHAVLRESTGTVGAELKARGHRLTIGSRSLIGWVTANRQPRVALDVGEDPFHFKNPLLPETRSELAIPLIAGDQLLGALDVQSTRPDAFGDSDVQVLQTVADQLSIAIQNAQLFQRTEASLSELSTLYQRMTGASWRNLLRGRVREKVYTAPGAADQSDGASAAAPLQVPLAVRDQTVGVIELYGRRPEEWSPEERAALETVAAQIATALESTSLLDEAQRRRLREQLINEVTYQLRSTLNPTSVVQSGIRELGRALGATEVVIKLASAEAPAPGQSTGTPAGPASRPGGER